MYAQLIPNELLILALPTFLLELLPCSLDLIT